MLHHDLLDQGGDDDDGEALVDEEGVEEVTSLLGLDLVVVVVERATIMRMTKSGRKLPCESLRRGYVEANSLASPAIVGSEVVGPWLEAGIVLDVEDNRAGWAGSGGGMSGSVLGVRVLGVPAHQFQRDGSGDDLRGRAPSGSRSKAIPPAARSSNDA